MEPRPGQLAAGIRALHSDGIADVRALPGLVEQLNNICKSQNHTLSAQLLQFFPSTFFF